MSFLVEYSGVVIGVLLGILPPMLDERRADRSINWLSRKNSLTLFLGILSIVLSIITVRDNNAEKSKAYQKIDSLHNEVRSGSRTLKSVKRSQDKFEKVLLEKFNIKKDSVTNMPKRVNVYNTNIGKAQTVNIGNEY